MAFKKDQTELTTTLKKSLEHNNQREIKKDSDPSFERKKNYQFMLKPSNREKLRKLTAASGQRSDSAFLDDLIESM